MQYLQSYQFIFDHPNWVGNVGLMAVCQFLIPIVGPIVCLGYFGEMIEGLHTRKPGPPYTTFEFNRFGDYLRRGFYVFVAVMVLVVITIPLIVIGMLLSGALVAVLTPNGQEPSGVVVLISTVLAGLIYCSGMAFLNVFTVPVTLSVELTQDLGGAWNLAWHRDFVARVWWEMLLSFLFLVASLIPIMVVGTLMCCVGIYPLSLLFLFAQQHQNYQLYELYLERRQQLLLCCVIYLDNLT